MIERPKKGDLITVQAEAASTAYAQGGDFDTLKIETTEDVEGFGDLAALAEKQIYKINKNNAHQDIVAAGGNTSYYTIQGEAIESLAFVTKGEVKVNGEHDIPFKTSKITKLSETYFFDELAAQAIATGLNRIELDRAKLLQKAMDKVVVMLDQIVDKASV